MAQTREQVAARAAISASGLRHREVATHLGIDSSKLSKSLSGVRRFTTQELRALAELTGVTLESLDPHHNGTEQPARKPDDESSPPKASRDFEARKSRIVNTAWTLFTERGYHSVTIAHIAKAAGMSASAVHYYFHSKNDIFLATLDLCAREAAQRRASGPRITDPSERLIHFLRVQLDGSEESMREWTTWAQFWSSSPTFPDAKEAAFLAYGRWQAQLRGIDLEGMAAGQFTATDPDHMVNAVTAMIDGLGVQMLTGALSPADAADAVTAYVSTWFASTPVADTTKEND